MIIIRNFWSAEGADYFLAIAHNHEKFLHDSDSTFGKQAALCYFRSYLSNLSFGVMKRDCFAGETGSQ